MWRARRLSCNVLSADFLGITLEIADKFSTQIDRIKSKLIKVRKVDAKRQVFGAHSHDYELGAPLTEGHIQAFENRYDVKLPLCYVTFLCHVGNRRASSWDSAAGPFDGIYPLGHSLDEFTFGSTAHLNKVPGISAGMSDKSWSKLAHVINSENDISDAEYESARQRIYGGILPIGSQGCQSFHGLLLSGPDKGRVVNIDIEGYKPRFAYEDNFLDWYERWLDEISSGTLPSNSSYWFGYVMGGGDVELFERYPDAAGVTAKLDVLCGFTKLKQISIVSCHKLLEICDDEATKLRHFAVGLLTKFDHDMAIPKLLELTEQDDEACRVACESIWHAKGNAARWVPLLQKRLKTVQNPETFRFITYIFIDAMADYSADLKPFGESKNEDIRATVFHSLGKLANKVDLIDTFMLGLEDTSARVVHTTLQALDGVRDRRLFPSYYHIIKRFTVDENYIHINLEHRLREYGFSDMWHFMHAYEAGDGRGELNWRDRAITSLNRMLMGHFR